MQGSGGPRTKWKICLPLSLCVKRGLSSPRMTPRPVQARTLPHRLVFPLVHMPQCPQNACAQGRAQPQLVVAAPA